MILSYFISNKSGEVLSSEVKMNHSELENKIRPEVYKCVLDLRKQCGQSEFNKTVKTFLESRHRSFLLLENPDVSASARKLRQVLKEIQCLPDFTIYKDYLGNQNQTIIKWVQLSENFKSSEVIPKFKNLLVCLFHEPVELLYNHGELINTILEELSFTAKRKVIFIVTSKDNAFFKEVRSNSCIYYNESANKIMPFYELSHESLLERASCGDDDAVERILEGGVNVNDSTSDGTTALHVAAANGHRDVALKLLRKGADCVPDRYEATPLHYASSNGHRNIVKLFLENDVVDVNIKGPMERTALHEAAIFGEKDVALTLLKYGAEHLPDEYKDTPLHLAAEYGRTDIVTLFLNYGIDINIRGCSGMTALHKAVRYHSKDVIVMLVKKGADINLKTDQNKTASDLAYPNDIRLLIEKTSEEVNVNIGVQPIVF